RTPAPPAPWPFRDHRDVRRHARRRAVARARSGADGPGTARGPRPFRDAVPAAAESRALARVVLDDELLVEGHRNLVALGAVDDRDAQVLVAGREVAGDLVVGVHALGGLDERHHLARLLADGDDLARLHPVGRDVDLLAVHGDVAVRDVLAGRVDGRRQAGPEHHADQAQLELGDHLLTGTPGPLLGGLVDAGELLLGQVVVPAQLLLLRLADRVVAGGAADATAVLARGVGALLEVADRLTGQRGTRAPGQPHLRSGVAH